MAHALPAPCQYEAGNVDVEVKAGVPLRRRLARHAVMVPLQIGANAVTASRDAGLPSP